MDPIGGPLVIAVFVAFPAWVAYVVYKRGRRAWAVGTALSIPAFLGPFIGLLALYQTADAAGRPLEEPCPDCGGQEGSTIEATLDRKTGAWMRTLPAVISGVLGLAVIAFGVGMAILIWVQGDDFFGPTLEWENGSFIAGLSFLVVGLSFGGWLSHTARRFLTAKRVRGLRSTCMGCGHVWIDSAEVDLPPWVPGVRWLGCSDEFLWGRNSEKTSYFIFSRADLEAPVHTYPGTEMEAGKAQFRTLAGSWWIVAGTRQPQAYTGWPLLPPAPPPKATAEAGN